MFHKVFFDVSLLTLSFIYKILCTEICAKTAKKVPYSSDKKWYIKKLGIYETKCFVKYSTEMSGSRVGRSIVANHSFK